MNTKTILLVEDNADDVTLTLSAFKSCNITSTVVVARDGAQALEQLFSSVQSDAPQARFAVVLLDLNLPKVNGLEVLQRIRGDARTRLLPVVMLTSSREDKDVAAAYHLGANSYLRKPVDFDQFVEAARHLGRYWLLMNEVPSTFNSPTSAPSEGDRLAGDGLE